MLKPICAIGPSMGKEGVLKLERMAQNAAQNETFFILTCLAGAQANTLPDQATTAVNVFVGARILHLVFQIGTSYGMGVWLRTVAFLSGMSANIYIAYHAMIGAM